MVDSILSMNRKNNDLAGKLQIRNCGRAGNSSAFIFMILIILNPVLLHRNIWKIYMKNTIFPEII